MACRRLPGPEVAFAGRSNAGKSSAINTLCDHVRLAFVSKTPGAPSRSTSSACATGRAGGSARLRLRRGTEAVRRQWQRLLEDYLTRRPNLIGLVLIMDSRHLKDRDRS
jgi:GTP-binding protein